MATKHAPRLSGVEKEAILEEAVSLIKEPANWVTGHWKCEVYKTDEKGKAMRDEHGNPIREYDRYNRPLAQYCIEGAVNQAAFNVLGDERARKFGVTTEGDDMTDRLGLNELTRELYPEYESAMDFNDSGAATHSEIVGLLRAGVDAVRTKLRR